MIIKEYQKKLQNQNFQKRKIWSFGSEYVSKVHGGTPKPVLISKH